MIFGRHINVMPYNSSDDPAKVNSYNQFNLDDLNAIVEGGYSGEMIDAFSASGATGSFNSWVAAANAIGATNLRFFVNWDFGCGTVCIAASAIVSTMLSLGNSPYYARINGKPLLTTYSGQSLGDAWWETNVLGPLAAAGMPVTFIPNVQPGPDQNSVPPTVANWQAAVNSFPHADGYFNFGYPGAPNFHASDPNIGHYKFSMLDGNEAGASVSHAAGKLYMSPLFPMFWSQCHSARQYVDNQFGLGLANVWSSIINVEKPDLIELTTWDDLTETSYFSPPTYANLPSESSDYKTFTHIGYYELQKYFVQWYETGAAPTITNDAVFWSHRAQPMNTTKLATEKCSLASPATVGQLWGLVQDDVYITTALTAPATLTLTIAGYTQTLNVPAGLSNNKFPFTPGTPNINLSRNGATLVNVTSETINGASSAPINFGEYTGYYVVGGDNSATWAPSNRAVQANKSPFSTWFAP